MTWGTWGTGGVRCKIKEGWDGAGREGDALGYFNNDKVRGAQKWVVVFWDDEEDPDNFKAAGLLFKRLGERTFKVEPFLSGDDCLSRK